MENRWVEGWRGAIKSRHPGEKTESQSGNEKEVGDMQEGGAPCNGGASRAELLLLPLREQLLVLEDQGREGEDPDAVGVGDVIGKGLAHHRDDEVEHQHGGQRDPGDVQGEHQRGRLCVAGQVRADLAQVVAERDPEQLRDQLGER